jgi:hypothetical protein
LDEVKVKYPASAIMPFNLAGNVWVEWSHWNWSSAYKASAISQYSKDKFQMKFTTKDVTVGSSKDHLVTPCDFAHSDKPFPVGFHSRFLFLYV